MSEYREKRTVIEGAPIASRPVVETRYDSVVRDRPAMSGGAIAALVLAAIAAAVVITMLILNSQQSTTEDQLAQERARAAAAEQTPASQPQQQPVIVMPHMPQSQPATVPVPYPVPSQSVPAESAPSSASIEMDVSAKLLNDPDLRSPSVDVKVAVMAGTVTLRGHVPTEELKTRAERLARTANGVRNVVNDLVVEP